MNLSTKMKYVMNNQTGQFILIPLTMNHNDIRGCFKATSAGFVQFEVTKANEYGEVFLEAICWGESHSLQLKADREDSDIITRSMRLT